MYESLEVTDKNPGVAQLVARLTGGQEAVGSNPATPTIVSIHNTSEYSLFFFYISSKFKLLCIEQVLACSFLLCR